ncbi:MAG: MFS transporter [Chloroflexi bacterium]|nr:MFS transporter [Chloroflexota bacterium]
MKQSPGIKVGRALLHFLILVILIRLVRDTSVRMMFPFLPVYAQGLGITLTAIGLLMTVRTALVVSAPYFGSIADRRGSHRLLVFGYLLLAAGLLGFSFSQGFVSALLAIILLGVADAIIVSLAQAYVSVHSPPELRGRSLVTVEYSWAITGIVILPVLGWLIDVGGWRLPFQLLSICAVGATLLLVFVLPADPPHHAPKPLSLGRQATIILHDRSAAATLLVNAAIFMAAETIFVIWGTHLTQNFSLGPATIGLVASLIGMGELGGAIISSLLIDRTGKRLGVLAGILVFLTILALFPILNQSVIPLIAGIVLASLCLEYIIVSMIPLISQQRPGSRATMLAMGAMLGAVSRAFTDSVALYLFENLDFLANILYAFLSLLVALWVLWRWVDERQEV